MSLPQFLQEIVVTIDGPAGGGKSSVAKELAKKINFDFLETGGMYRAVALAGWRAGVDWEDPQALTAIAKDLAIDNRDGKTFLNGEDVTFAIRSSEVTKLTHFAANNPAIREIMVDLQRKTAAGRKIVTEGRDQGTVVFPRTPFKFYLTASPEERARRRLLDLQNRGENPDFSQILKDIIARDTSDSARSVGPLRQPEDAVFINSDQKSIDEVVSEMENVILDKMAKMAP